MELQLQRADKKESKENKQPLKYKQARLSNQLVKFFQLQLLAYSICTVLKKTHKKLMDSEKQLRPTKYSSESITKYY